MIILTKKITRLFAFLMIITLVSSSVCCNGPSDTISTGSGLIQITPTPSVSGHIVNGIQQPDFFTGTDNVALTYSDPEPTTKEFEGAIIRVACPSGRMAESLSVDGQEWAKRTGATLIVQEIEFKDLFEQMAADILNSDGNYDIILYPHYLSGDIMGTGKLVPLETLMDTTTINKSYAEGGLEWDSYFRNYREIYGWYNGHVYSLAVDGDVFQVAYRKDLWIEYAEEFKDKYGFALRPDDPTFPETWQQYYDIAEFFNTQDDLYGTVDINVRSRASAWHFLVRYVSYLQKDNMYDGDVYFDKETMTPLINSPAGVMAMEDSIKSVTSKYTKIDSISFGWTEMQQAWMNGQTAIQFTWPAMLNIARRPGSLIPDGIASTGYSMIPGSEIVYDVASDSLMQLESPHRATMMAHGWQYSIVDTCKNQKAAFDLLRWMTTGDRLVHNTQKLFWEYEPVKQWEWYDPQVIAQSKDAPSYLSSLALCNEVSVPDLRIPGAVQMYDAIEIYRGKALAGKMTAKEAVDAIAADWVKIINQRGFEQMQAAYIDTTTPHSLEDLLAQMTPLTPVPSDPN